MAYSLDLRERAVDAYERGDDTYSAVAERFSIGVATLDRWVARFRQTGSVAPLPHAGAPPSKTNELHMTVLCELVAQRSDGTRAEFAEALAEQTGVELSVASMGRRLTQLGYTRKKSPFTRPKERPKK